jgi:hypothetical protein
LFIPSSKKCNLLAGTDTPHPDRNIALAAIFAPQFVQNITTSLIRLLLRRDGFGEYCRPHDGNAE